MRKNKGDLKEKLPLKEEPFTFVFEFQNGIRTLITQNKQ